MTGDRTLERAYKVPSLRNVAGRAPYMDAGQFATLAEVLDHYNRAPAAPAGHTELKPLRLKAERRPARHAGAGRDRVPTGAADAAPSPGASRGPPSVRRGVTVFTSAEVVCVDGLDRVEAVIVRRMGTGRLIGVNASGLQVFGIVDDASSLARRMETLPAS